MGNTRVIRLILADNLQEMQDEINKFMLTYSGTDPHVTAMATDFDYTKGQTVYFACVEYNIQKDQTN